MTKNCTRCGETYPATKEYFFVHKGGRNGLNARCKKCIMETQNKERVAENKRRWYDNNTEKAKQTARLHYQENRERHKEQTRVYKEQHPEVMKRCHTRHYQENKEQYIERSRTRYAEKKDEILQQCKEYRQNNKEKIKETFNRYVQDPRNLERVKMHKARRKQRKRNLPADLTPDQWLGILEKFNHQCCYCGQKVESLQQDHFIPVSKGRLVYGD